MKNYAFFVPIEAADFVEPKRGMVATDSRSNTVNPRAGLRVILRPSNSQGFGTQREPLTRSKRDHVFLRTYWHQSCCFTRPKIRGLHVTIAYHANPQVR